jgi:hypothetical protein
MQTLTWWQVVSLVAIPTVGVIYQMGKLAGRVDAIELRLTELRDQVRSLEIWLRNGRT